MQRLNDFQQVARVHRACNRVPDGLMNGCASGHALG